MVSKALKPKLIFGFFLILFCFFTFSCATPSRPSVGLPAPLKNLPILQGYTSQTSAQFTVLVPKDKKFRYFVRAESHEGQFEVRDIEVQRFRNQKSDWAVDRVKVSGIDLARVYQFEVYDVFDSLIDTREFSALDITKPQAKVIAAACMDHSYVVEQKKIWPELLARAPQMIFFLGDNVYGTKIRQLVGPPSLDEIWQRYVEVRLQLEIFRSPKLIPTLAIWDDGDYSVNNGDSESETRRDAAEVFKIFYAQEPDFIHLKSGPGTSRWLQAFQMNFALMDNRSFRSPKSAASPEDQTHWGTAQERWLLQIIKDHPQPTWILNGDQIFGGYHQFESYEGERPDSFSAMTKQLAALSAPVIFLTGDRHLTEVMKVDSPQSPLRTFELTTSPLHAKTYPPPWDKTPNPRQIEGRAQKLNYMQLDMQNTNGALKVKLTSFSLNNEILFHRSLSIDQRGKKLTTD